MVSCDHRTEPSPSFTECRCPGVVDQSRYVPAGLVLRLQGHVEALKITQEKDPSRFLAHHGNCYAGAGSPATAVRNIRNLRTRKVHHPRQNGIDEAPSSNTWLALANRPQHLSFIRAVQVNHLITVPCEERRTEGPARSIRELATGVPSHNTTQPDSQMRSLCSQSDTEACKLNHTS